MASIYREGFPSYNEYMPCRRKGERFSLMARGHLIYERLYMKRFLCIFLLIAILLPAGGCSFLISGRQVCLDFLTAISQGDYNAAYDLLDEAVQADSILVDSENAADQEAAEAQELELETGGRITRERFIDKYTSIFELLQISSVAYENIQIEEGDIFTIATFTGIYTSGLCGEMVEEFKMIALRAGGRWVIEWAPNLIFPDMEWGDTVRKATIPAQRGDIMAEQSLLATTVGKITVYAVPSRIEDEDLFATQVGALLGMTADSVKTSLGKAYEDLAVLKEFYTDELTSAVEEQLLSIAGIGIDRGNYAEAREYPEGDMLAHIIGYTGIVSAETAEETMALVEEMNQGRDPDDGLYTTDSYVGKLGLESRYEEELRGKDGYRIYIHTSAGTNRRTLYTKPVENGMDLHLTINMELQERLDFILECELMDEETAGAVVVMNPKTGDIEAMASWPSYDLNLFARGISSTDYAELTGQANTPLYNRLTQGLYPPGSVLKAFTAAAALDTGTLDENYVFEGEIEDDYWLPTEFGPWIGSRIKRATIRHRYLPYLNMRSAIVYSDNIYFANAALLMGWENFESYMEQVGIGASMPFDLNVASSQIHNEDADLSLMLLAESGYGQGQVLITPLQMATLFCAFANDGDVPVPHLIEAIYQENGVHYEAVYQSTDQIWLEDIISENARSIIEPYLQDVVDPSLNGTGRSLGVNSCQIAAKTGTAEIGEDKSREISWFAGYRCDVEPGQERLVLVMLEIPTSGAYSDTKFTIARELLKMSAP